MTMTIMEFISLIAPSWSAALQPEFSKDYFKQLYDFVEEELCTFDVTVYPPVHQIFSCFDFFPIDEVKVVIIGQDPYHDEGQANGLCFSVPEGVDLPPSIVYIYKEVANNYPRFLIPSHGDLTGWADQKVLLLNSYLTVRKGEAKSHAGQGWETFTDAVITWISYNTTGVVFMLWGGHAQKKARLIDSNKHKILGAYHPSPSAANRGHYFVGCGHFSLCNEHLREQDKTPIEWTRGWMKDSTYL